MISLGALRRRTEPEDQRARLFCAPGEHRRLDDDGLARIGRESCEEEAGRLGGRVERVVPRRDFFHEFGDHLGSRGKLPRPGENEGPGRAN